MAAVAGMRGVGGEAGEGRGEFPEHEDVAGMLADLADNFLALAIGALLPPALYRALPQRVPFLAALDSFDGVIARVIGQRRAAGLDPAQGRAAQVEPMKPMLKAPGSWNYALETIM